MLQFCSLGIRGLENNVTQPFAVSWKPGVFTTPLHTHIHTSARAHTRLLALGLTLSPRHGNLSSCRAVIGQSVLVGALQPIGGRPAEAPPSPPTPAQVARAPGMDRPGPDSRRPLPGPRLHALGREAACAPGSGDVSSSGRAPGPPRRPGAELATSWPARPAPAGPAPAPPPSGPTRAATDARTRKAIEAASPLAVGARPLPAQASPVRGPPPAPRGPTPVLRAAAPGSRARASQAGTRTGRAPGARSPEVPGRARRTRGRDAGRADGAWARHAGPRRLLPHREPAGGRGQRRWARGPRRRRPRGRAGRRRRPGGWGRRAGAAAAAAAAATATAARGRRARRGGAGPGPARARRAGPRAPAAPRSRAAPLSGPRRRDALVPAGARWVRRRPQP